MSATKAGAAVAGPGGQVAALEYNGFDYGTPSNRSISFVTASSTKPAVESMAPNYLECAFSALLN
jgi:hypothetical protein